MKLAIVGSRSLNAVDLSKYIPNGVAEIVSGGACGIDTCAREYALRKISVGSHSAKPTEGFI